MSDFAHFVAAALRDMAIYHLLEENEDLREQNRALREQHRATEMVAITGSGGSPIYAHGHFEEDGQFASDPSCWQVDLSQQATVPLSALRHLEIHFGAIRLALLDDTQRFQAHRYGESSIHIAILFVNTLQFCTGMIVGPATAAEQAAMANPSGDDGLVDSVMRAFADDIESKTVTFTCVWLPLESVSFRARRRAEDQDEGDIAEDDEGGV